MVRWTPQEAQTPGTPDNPEPPYTPRSEFVDGLSIHRKIANKRKSRSGSDQTLVSSKSDPQLRIESPHGDESGRLFRQGSSAHQLEAHQMSGTLPSASSFEAPAPSTSNPRLPSQPATSFDANAFVNENLRGSEQMNYLVGAMQTVMVTLAENLKFTKAVYRGTKKSLTGPGYEVAHLESRTSSFTASPTLLTDMQSELTMPRSSMPLTNSTYVGSSAMVHHVGSSAMGSNAMVAMPSSGIRNTKATIKTTHTTKASIPEDGPITLDASVDDANRVAKSLKVARAISQNLDERKTVKVQMWRFFEDQSSSKWAFWYARVRNFMLMLSVIFALLDTLELSILPWQEYQYVNAMTYIQLILEALFGMELACRFYVCRNRHSFVIDFHNIVDLVSILPCILRVLLLTGQENNDVILTLYGIIPVLRLVKLVQHFDKFHLLLSAFLQAAEIMPMLLFTMFLIASTFAAAIYYCEGRESMPNLPIALYFSIVTCSTVGYGDYSPVTDAGKIWCSLLAIVGPMYMAMPIGIIGTAFSEVWNDRHRLLLLQKMRKCVSDAGYSASELIQIFKVLDQNGDGSLDFAEFEAWLDIMDISASEEFIQQVFGSFDADDEGTICFNEFLRGLYPRSYTHIHGNLRKSGAL